MLMSQIIIAWTVLDLQLAKMFTRSSCSWLLLLACLVLAGVNLVSTDYLPCCACPAAEVPPVTPSSSSISSSEDD